MRVDSLFDTFQGLPVHALVVHAVVVLVPLTAIGAVIMALSPSFSRRFGTVVVVVAGLAAVASVVARQSGEQLAARVGSPQPHAGLGAVLPWFAIAFFLVVMVFWLFDRGVPASKARPAWLVVLAVVLVVVAAAAAWWTIRVGQSGSEAVWQSVIENSQPRP